MTADTYTISPQFQRAVERLCRGGDRLVAETFLELGRKCGITDEVAELIARFARADPDLLHAVGADRFPLSPIREVQ